MIASATILAVTLTSSATAFVFSHRHNSGRSFATNCPLRPGVFCCPLFTTKCDFLFKIQLSQSKNDATLNDDDDIENLFKLAMEQDEEWYNSFVRDVLDEPARVAMCQERTTSTSHEKRREEEIKNGRGGNAQTDLNGHRKDDKGETKNFKSTDTDTKVNTKETITTPSLVTPQEMMQFVQQKPLSDATSPISPETMNSVPQKPGDNASSNNNNNNVIVEFTDSFDTRQKVPMLTLTALGYTFSDISRLKAKALEFILEEEISKPNKGLPLKWMVKGEREVRVLLPRKPPVKNIHDESSKFAKERVTHSQTGSATKTPRPGVRRSNEEVGWERRRQPRRSVYGEDRKPAQRRIEDERNRFWMDLPTFRNYLKKEANLRLSILGPGWKDWVQNESKWRYGLYKKWLDALEIGIGNDVMQDISYSSPVREKIPKRRHNPREEVRRRSAEEGRRKRFVDDEAMDPTEQSDRQEQPRTRRTTTDDYRPGFATLDDTDSTDEIDLRKYKSRSRRTTPFDNVSGSNDSYNDFVENELKPSSQRRTTKDGIKFRSPSQPARKREVSIDEDDEEIFLDDGDDEDP